MNRFLLTTVAAGALAVAGQAQAQDTVFFSDGVIVYENVDGDGGSVDGIVADFNVGFRAAGETGFGAYLGVDAFDIEDENVSVVYGAAFYDFGSGQISLGAPRLPSYDFILTPTFGGSETLGAFSEFSAFSSTFGEFAAYFDEEPPYGVRYDGDYGAFNVGVYLGQYVDISNSGDNATVGQIAASYETGPTTLWLVYEGTDIENGPTLDTYGAGVEYDDDMFFVGLSAINTDFFGLDSETLTQLYGGVRPLDFLELRAGYATVAGEDFDAYTVGAEVTFLENGFLSVDYIDADVEEFTVAALGWRLEY